MGYTEDVVHKVASPAFKYGLKISSRHPLRPNPDTLPWFERQRAMQVEALRNAVFQSDNRRAFSYVWLAPYSRVLGISASTEEGIGNRDVIKEIVVYVFNPHEFKKGEIDIDMRATRVFRDEAAAMARVHELAKRIRQLAGEGKLSFIEIPKPQQRRGRRPRKRRWNNLWAP